MLYEVITCRETGHTQGACPRNESPAGSGKKRQRDSTADTNSDDWPHPRKSRSGVRTQSHGESSDDEPVPQQNFAKSIATIVITSYSIHYTKLYEI